MYAIYREVHPPTGVEHCLECHFVDGSQKNLVIAATSILKVFQVVSMVQCTPILCVHVSTYIR